MNEENEVIMLILGIGILVLIQAYKAKIKRIHGWKMLLAGFYLLVGACAFTILEELVLNNLLNFMEHLFYSLSAVLITIWCWKAASGLWREG